MKGMRSGRECTQHFGGSLKTCIGVSSFLVLFTFGYVAFCLNIVSTDVQDHPRFHEPPGIGRAGSQRVLSGEVPVAKIEAVGYGDANTQQSVLQGDELWDRFDGERRRGHVNLVIAVPSVRPERREAIRQTWLTWGDDRVVLRFFVEPPNEAEHENHQEISALLAEESRTYGDVVIQDIGTGMNFGVKLLEAMRWMVSHYSFDFLLRLDDDYFLCLERLLEEVGCLLKSGKRQSPVYAGLVVCRDAPFIDEAYILLSSVVVHRILAASDLQCSGRGTLTMAAWVGIGGPGNPHGDVAWVRDWRLDHTGEWWKQNQTSPVCEQLMGIHRTYPDQMIEYWNEMSSKMNESQLTSDDCGCDGMLRYEDDGKCPATSCALNDNKPLVKRLRKDNVQPCDSFKSRESPEGKKMWCGAQGC